MNQPLPAAEIRRMGLLLHRFDLHEAHLGLAGRDLNCLGIGSIILLALDERAKVLRRDQFYHVPKSFPLSECLATCRHLLRQMSRSLPPP
jgi:hypothetical protein